MKLISGITKPTKGKVWFNNQDLGTLSDNQIGFMRQHIGIVFQDHKILYDRNVLQNVILPLRISGYQPRKAEERARIAIEKVGLKGRENDMPIALSGGEQQRLCIARAVVHQPSLLIADEPSASLDRAYALDIMELFKTFHEAGTTVIGSRSQAMSVHSSRPIPFIWPPPHPALFMYLGIQSGQSVLGKLNESPQITVYMDTDAASSDADTVKNLLQRDSRIDKVRFISKQEGLEELQTNLDQNLVSMLDGSPLPDVFIVTPTRHFSDQMQAIYKDITKLPRVESATMDTEWVQTLYRINGFIRKILWFLSLTLGMAFVLVAHNTIRLQILSRKEGWKSPSCWVRPLPHPPPFPLSGNVASIFSAAVSLGFIGWLLAEVRSLVDAIFKPTV